MEVAPSLDSAELTTAFDVLGAIWVLLARSLLPVTDVPDRTAITVPGTIPVFSVCFASAGSDGRAAPWPGAWLPAARRLAADRVARDWAALPGVNPVVDPAGPAAAAAGPACPAAIARAAAAIAETVESFLRRGHLFAFIQFLPVHQKWTYGTHMTWHNIADLTRAYQRS
jgi:hypothetical protein